MCDPYDGLTTLITPSYVLSTPTTPLDIKEDNGWIDGPLIVFLSE